MANKSNKSTKKATSQKPTLKAKSTRKAAKRSTSYETVQSNIQKITYASGTVSYRVRVAGQSEFATSLKKAREIKKEMFA